MDEQELSFAIDRWITVCEGEDEATTKARRSAIAYYNGECPDIPAEENRSSVVSRDVRDTVAKIMPALMRVFLGGARVVDYVPQGPEDEAMAEQASDVISHKFENDWRGYEVFWSAIQDALQSRNGVIKWCFDEAVEVRAENVSGIPEADWFAMTAAPDVEVLEASAVPDPTALIDETGLLPQPMLYAGRLRYRTVKREVKITAIAPEDFLIDPDALNVETAQFCAHRTRLRKSDLVAMGYDREVVETLTGSANVEHDDLKSARRERTYFLNQNQSGDDANDPVDYYECFVRLDMDDDGIAELRRVCVARGGDGAIVLANDDWDDVPFADIRTEIVAHRREGRSIYDDIADLQRIKTVLWRQTLNNLYAQNMPQPIVQAEAVQDMDAIISPEFLRPILINPGRDVREVFADRVTPFTAEASFTMLEYADRVITDRTGISDASSGLSPDALQNQTAAATRVFENSATSRVELMARTIAETGLKRLFRGLLRLVAKHQDKEETIRLRGQWVTYDPGAWNVNMDASVNVGLGAGSRERDVMMMQFIGAQQEKIIQGFGPPGQNPLVSLTNVWNALKRGVEAAGQRDAELFFTRPTPQAEAMLAQPRPSPEQQKIEAQMALEREKMAVQRDKESAQAEADILVKQAEMQRDERAAQLDREADAQRAAMEMEIERMKLDAAAALKAQELAAQESLERMKMAFQVELEAMRKRAQHERAEPALEVTHEAPGDYN